MGWYQVESKVKALGSTGAVREILTSAEDVKRTVAYAVTSVELQYCKRMEVESAKSDVVGGHRDCLLRE